MISTQFPPHTCLMLLLARRGSTRPALSDGYHHEVSRFNMQKNDIRNKPAYTLSEAARYVKVAPATLRSWVVGRAYPKADGVAQFRPLIHPAIKQPASLSFWNLIEAHVLRSLRTKLRTDAGKLLLERYGQLIELSASGQIAMRHLFNEHLARVEWDQWKFPVRLYPFASGSVLTDNRPIAIDPQISFGRPVIASRGISTGAIAERIDAGETAAELADDYGLSEREIEEAVLYEHAA